MSRELLKRVLNALADKDVPSTISNAILIKDIKEELAKPEPEPVAWMYEQNGEHWFQMYTPIEDVENYIPLYTN